VIPKNINEINGGGSGIRTRGGLLTTVRFEHWRGSQADCSSNEATFPMKKRPMKGAGCGSDFQRTGLSLSPCR
jgi:hypothetical protein